MTAEAYWRELQDKLGLTRFAGGAGGMALAADPNGTHFLVHDPEALPPGDRQARLDDILRNPAKFALGY